MLYSDTRVYFESGQSGQTCSRHSAGLVLTFSGLDMLWLHRGHCRVLIAEIEHIYVRSRRITIVNYVPVPFVATGWNLHATKRHCDLPLRILGSINML